MVRRGVGAGAGVTCITAGFVVYLLNCDADEDRVVSCCCCRGGGGGGGDDDHADNNNHNNDDVECFDARISAWSMTWRFPPAEPAMDVHLNPSAQAARL